MNRRKIWEVDIDIIGPISIADNISFKQVKGFDEDQFYSNVVLQKEKYSLQGTTQGRYLTGGVPPVRFSM